MVKNEQLSMSDVAMESSTELSEADREAMRRSLGIMSKKTGKQKKAM